MNSGEPLIVEEHGPAIEAALEELRGLIARHYPAATFVVARGEDPPGVYLKATVDVEDTDEVVPTFLDRMLELQIEEGLPIYVIPLQPPARVLERMRQKARQPIEARLALT